MLLVFFCTSETAEVLRVARSGMCSRSAVFLSLGVVSFALSCLQVQVLSLAAQGINVA